MDLNEHILGQCEGPVLYTHAHTHSSQGTTSPLMNNEQMSFHFLFW